MARHEAISAYQSLIEQKCNALSNILLLLWHRIMLSWKLSFVISRSQESYDVIAGKWCSIMLWYNSRSQENKTNTLLSWERYICYVMITKPQDHEKIGWIAIKKKKKFIFIEFNCHKFVKWFIDTQYIVTCQETLVPGL